MQHARRRLRWPRPCRATPGGGINALVVTDLPGQLHVVSPSAIEAALFWACGTAYLLAVRPIVCVSRVPPGTHFTYSGSKITKIEVRTGADTSTRIRQVEYA